MSLLYSITLRLLDVLAIGDIVEVKYSSNEYQLCHELNKTLLPIFFHMHS